MSEVSKFRKYLVQDINESTSLIDSKVTVLLKDRLKETTKGGGKVDVRVKGNSVSVAFFEFEKGQDIAPFDKRHTFDGTFSGGKWKKVEVGGLAEKMVTKKTISDDEAVKIITAIFDKAKKA